MTQTALLAILAGLAVLLFAISSAVGSDALPALNAIRSYAGLPTVRYDRALQIEAQRRAAVLAQSGRLSHGYSKRRVGSYEGIGYRSGYDPAGRRFRACGMNQRRYTYAGAATAQSRGRTWYVLLYR